MSTYTKDQILAAGKHMPHILKEGHKGGFTAWVQTRLNWHLGAPRLKIDGEFGPATTKKVKEFQALKGIEVDGIVGPTTVTFLTAGKGKVPNQTKPTVKPPVKPNAGPEPVKPGKTTHKAEAALKFAARYVGKTESPRGSNKIPILQQLGKKQGWSPSIYNMGWSYCAYALSACLSHVGSWLGEIVSGTWSGYTGVYCPTMKSKLEEMEKKGKCKRLSIAQAQAGDVVLFDWTGDGIEDHVGFVRGKVTSQGLPTREFNTSSGNAGSQSNGDGVFDRTRLSIVIDSIWRIYD